jgi:hypothetical protein
MKKTAKKVARRPVAKKTATRKVSASSAKKKPVSGVVKPLEVVRATQTARKRQKAA